MKKEASAYIIRLTHLVMHNLQFFSNQLIAVQLSKLRDEKLMGDWEMGFVNVNEKPDTQWEPCYYPAVGISWDLLAWMGMPLMRESVHCLEDPCFISFSNWFSEELEALTSFDLWWNRRCKFLFSLLILSVGRQKPFYSPVGSSPDFWDCIPRPHFHFILH